MSVHTSPHCLLWGGRQRHLGPWLEGPLGTQVHVYSCGVFRYSVRDGGTCAWPITPGWRYHQEYGHVNWDHWQATSILPMNGPCQYSMILVYRPPMGHTRSHWWGLEEQENIWHWPHQASIWFHIMSPYVYIWCYCISGGAVMIITCSLPCQMAVDW